MRGCHPCARAAERGRRGSPSYVRALLRRQARVAGGSSSVLPKRAGVGRGSPSVRTLPKRQARVAICARAAKRAGAGRGSPSVRALPKGQARVTILCARELPEGQARVREGHRLSLRWSILALVVASRRLRLSAAVVVIRLWRLGACRHGIVALACDPVPLVRAILIIRGGGRSLGQSSRESVLNCSRMQWSAGRLGLINSR